MSRTDANQNDRKVEPTAASDSEKAAMLRALSKESAGSLAYRLQGENEASRANARAQQHRM